MNNNALKKFIPLIFLFLLIYGCENKFDSIIDPSLNIHEIRLLWLSAPDSLILKDSSGTVVSHVKINSPEFIKAVYINIFNPLREQKNKSKIFMLDDGNLNNDGDKTAGDSIYSAILSFSKNDPNGKYNLKYFVTDKNNKDYLLAVKPFYFRNGALEYPPVIFNLTMPDTASRGEEITFSIEVKDSNGLEDIPDGGVFYQLHDPGGKLIINSHGISRFPMSDKGDENISGDKIANDGIFTQKLTFPASQPTGKWKFTFQAIDKSDSTSNILIHYLILK